LFSSRILEQARYNFCSQLCGGDHINSHEFRDGSRRSESNGKGKSKSTRKQKAGSKKDPKRHCPCVIS